MFQHIRTGVDKRLFDIIFSLYRISSFASPFKNNKNRCMTQQERDVEESFVYIALKKLRILSILYVHIKQPTKDNKLYYIRDIIQYQISELVEYASSPI